jgi:hypothetical protein
MSCLLSKVEQVAIEVAFSTVDQSDIRGSSRIITLAASSGFDRPSMIALASSQILELGARLWKGCRHPCKSLSRENRTLLTRATEERALPKLPEPAAARVASRRLVPAFAEPDIHSLSRAGEGRHRRLSLCSLPVLKQFEESLGSLISVAQSANGRTWQPALCVILMFSPADGD